MKRLRTEPWRSTTYFEPIGKRWGRRSEVRAIEGSSILSQWQRAKLRMFQRRVQLCTLSTGRHARLAKPKVGAGFDLDPIVGLGKMAKIVLSADQSTALLDTIRTRLQTGGVISLSEHIASAEFLPLGAVLEPPPARPHQVSLEQPLVARDAQDTDQRFHKLVILSGHGRSCRPTDWYQKSLTLMKKPQPRSGDRAGASIVGTAAQQSARPTSHPG